MMTALKIRKIGNSLGAIFPKELLSDLGAQDGDSVFIQRTPHGLVIRKGDPEFERKMEVAREVMRRRKAVLAELAK
jgi:putative addiction module antidote